MPQLDRTDIIALVELLTTARRYVEGQEEPLTFSERQKADADLAAAVANCEHIEVEEFA